MYQVGKTTKKEYSLQRINLCEFYSIESCPRRDITQHYNVPYISAGYGQVLHILRELRAHPNN